MKKIFIILSAIVAVNGLASCNSFVESDEPNPIVVICPPTNSGVVYNSTSEMAFTLFDKVNSLAEPNENFTISPLSLSETLAMVASGAEGETRNELNKFLGFEKMSQDDVNGAFKALNSWLPICDRRTTLNIANSMWFDEGFPVLDSYKKTNSNYFDAETKVVDLQTEKTMNDINSWCSKNTRGCIPKILDEPFDGDCVMALINALYFKGQWAIKFDKSKTSKKTFTSANGAESLVDMMYMNGKAFLYAAADNYSIAEFPYGNGEFCMDVILPDEGVALDDCLKKLTYSEFNKLLTRRSSEELVLSMPRMELKYDIELNKVLEDLGVKRIFASEEAELNGISSHSDLYVSLVKQFSYIKVDEEGTEAAAVTEAVIKVDSAGPDVSTPIEFNMNRPFAYIIRDTQTGTILFMGKVMTL
ncbi:MAG: serpin family protein [Bacteroidaceae bacterium]|nr:serpin family protein [Bacteroidaceae bacterium]